MILTREVELLKKILCSCVVILSVVGFIIYGFIRAPKVIHVNRQIEVTAYKVEDSSFSKKVTISLSGVFDEKSDSYLGKITLNGKEFTNCSLNPKVALMNCTEAEDEHPPRDLLGMVYASNDFKKWSLRVDSSYNSGKTENGLYTILNQGSTTSDNIILSLPARDRDSSLKVYDQLTK